VSRDLLVVSDLHLGEDLGARSVRTERLEAALVAFLDHHATDGRSWRLVVDGDMLDLVGAVVLPADAGILAGLHPDDHQYGLGGQPGTAAHKMERVVERHEPVFRALGRFLAAGNPVSIVIGNHDAELHWAPVQEVMRAALDRFAREAGATGDQAGDVTFHPWFFLEDGVAWIEHGHQYDPYCGFEEVLAPSTDEVEIDPNLGALLPRYIGTRMTEPVHDLWGLGFAEYLRFWARQGADRLLGILLAYLDVFWRMREHWASRVPERVAARTARARARLRSLARGSKVPEDRLLALRALAPSPIQTELGRIVRALHLDRLLLLLIGPALPLLVLLVTPWSVQPFAHAVVLALLGGWFAAALIAREPVDPSESMRLVAARIRAVMGVPIVVMGHTHVPTIDQDGRGGTYINTGTWVDADPARAFTHLRIEHTPVGIRARLCQWRDGVVAQYVGAGAETTSVLLPSPRRA
jgi:UDP-2,3-diacylglucosamine pyrophosphatase LpxH